MDISKVRKKIRDLGLERFKAEMEMLRDLSRKELLYGSVVKKYKACGKGGCCHPSPALNHHVTSIEPVIGNYI